MANIVTNPAPTATRAPMIDTQHGLGARLMAWIERRQTRRALAQLSDRELEDIGVSRHGTNELVRRITR